MLSRIGGRFRRFVQRLDPHSWVVRMLGLARHPEDRRRPGLLLIQIDGLSHGRLRDAIQRGCMPFLGRLLERESYRLHTLYSGLPSSTPAVQGELFYGVKGAVPAFGFRDPDTGELVTMLGQDASARVAAHVAAQGEGLLQGGSAYCDIYSGGASETHFSPSVARLRALFPAAGQLTLARFLLLHAAALVQAAVLVAAELVVALADCARGILSGQDPRQEVLFVPSRVALCILARELSVAGVRMDLQRGLPVIHLNLVGFDEQAHRRGPDSAFARWALSGIDRAIARLWRQAHASPVRDYHVWIHSDHGQETTVPFERATGRSLADGLSATLGDAMVAGAGFIAKGPLGHVYLRRGVPEADRAAMANRLVHEAGVPLVLVPEARHTVRAFTRDGAYVLPAEAGRVLGDDHPFLAEVAVDLVALCHHRAAGDLVISGFSRTGPMLTFPSEEGSHAGPGPEETHAFALLPSDARVRPGSGPHLRPLDLRHAALAQQGRAAPAPHAPPIRRREPRSPLLRVMTYNVHRCTGVDGVLSPDRIARVIAQSAPDVVALQEVDVGRRRTGGIDQVHEIAHRLEMEHHFHPALRVEDERYGDAILSRHPVRLVRAGPLPGTAGALLAEPRGAIWVTVEVGGRTIHVMNTHFGLLPGERLAQVEALLGPEWLSCPDRDGPVVLCGDFNATPTSAAYRRLAGRLRDAQASLDAHTPQNTWFSTWPLGRIDHVFVDASAQVRHVDVPRTSLARLASDHLPLVVDLTFA